jgi:DNA-binding MarR family transcriptional regulator
MDDKLSSFSYICYMANKQIITQNPELNKEQKAIELIMCIAREFQAAMSKSIMHLGISPLQVQILLILTRTPEQGLTVNQIKNRIAEAQPNVSRALNKLMDNKLILKIRSEQDQRVVHVKITSKGMAILEVAGNVLTTIQRLPLTDQETSELTDLLLKI